MKHLPCLQNTISLILNFKNHANLANTKEKSSHYDITQT